MVSDISRRDISNAALVGTVNFFAFLQVDYFREREKERKRERPERERHAVDGGVYHTFVEPRLLREEGTMGRLVPCHKQALDGTFIFPTPPLPGLAPFLPIARST